MWLACEMTVRLGVESPTPAWKSARFRACRLREPFPGRVTLCTVALLEILCCAFFFLGLNTTFNDLVTANNIADPQEHHRLKQPLLLMQGATSLRRLCYYRTP